MEHKGPAAESHDGTCRKEPRRGIGDEVWLFLVALVVRAFYFVLHTRSIYFDHPILDSLWIHQWAVALARGEPGPAEAYFRAPLYPTLIAGIYRLAGPQPWIIAALQHLLGAVSVVLLYRVGRMLIDRRTGMIAALLLAFYWVAVFFEGELLIVSLALCLGLLLLYLLVAAARTPAPRARRARLFTAGLVLGLAIIARPNFVVLLPLALGCGWFFPRVVGCASDARPRVGRLRDAGLVLCAVLIPIAPVTLRNWIVARDFVPVASQGGLNLYVGNGPGADGKTAMAPGETGPLSREQIEHRFRDNITLAGRQIAESDAGVPLKASAVSRYWLRRTWDHARTAPRRVAALFMRKVYYFLNAFEISDNRDLDAAQRESPWRYVAFVRLAWILPFAWLGVMVLPSGARRGLLAFAVLYGLSVVLFFVNARFRLPVVPVVFCFAAAGMVALWSALRRAAGMRPVARCANRWLLWLLVLLAGAGLANSRLAQVDERRGRPAFQLNHAQLLAEAGRWAEALAAYDQALEMEPVRLAAAFGRARVQERSGALEAAARSFADIVTQYPDFVAAHLAQARILSRLGRFEAAGAAYRAAVAAEPGNPETHFRLGLFLLEEKQFAAAADAYAAGLKLRPEDTKGWANLGYALASLDRYEEAIAAWEQILRIHPQDEMARRNIQAARAAIARRP